MDEGDNRGSISLTSFAPSRTSTTTICSKTFHKMLFHFITTVSGYRSHATTSTVFTGLVIGVGEKTTELSTSLRTSKVWFGSSFQTGAVLAQGPPLLHVPQKSHQALKVQGSRKPETALSTCSARQSLRPPSRFHPL